MGNPASVAQGPGLVGTFLNVFLYGIMVTQCTFYYSRYPKDRIWLKCLVVGLLIADTTNCVFDICWIYDNLVNHFGDVPYLESGNWVFATDPAMVGIISCTVQLFFAWRVKVLTNNLWVVAIISLTASTSFFGGVGTAIAIHFVPQFEQFQKFEVIVIIWLIGAAVCDAMITLSLTWHLRRHKTGFSGTDDILNKIIRLTVQNGLLTAVWASIDLVVYLSTPTGLHLAFNFPLAKLYTNSLMSSLNSRSGWRYQTSEHTDQKSRDMGVGGGGRRLDVVNLSTTTRPEVFVHVEQHEMVDVNDKRDVEWSSRSLQETERSTSTKGAIGSAV
ncbi:uncharacterized protein PHACADRAFT_261275 [Phanerochaete carnosa HHB-10118-sp]|uniref:DUF6534 domain-containing protein n=1 Tax=Phanerochaete carnosa (strain HHB-10118-sp) TaxID=650164 RepID=K5VMI7_PHACS|nr:uncharacterized protein PHACADRAFT_261275 [Phanerochaete carnosa HHB-10118-sp]EKM52683.1 hypothetical protein PHACADRAFT_261275 [Phanerochaete carnosa HHB-10118-sp]